MKRYAGVGLALALVLGVGSAGVLRAKDGGPGPGGRQGFFKELTDDQKAQLKAIHRAHRDAVTPIKDKLEDELDKLRALVEKDAGEKELAAGVDRVKELRKSLQAEREKLIDKAASVLTAKQRARAVVAIAGRMRHAMMGRMGGPGAGGMRGRLGMGRGGWGGKGRRNAPNDDMDEDEGPEMEDGPGAPLFSGGGLQRRRSCSLESRRRISM